MTTTTLKIFNGCHTIQNRTTGMHRTFSIRTQPKDAVFAPGARIISLLTGPDTWDAFGFVNDHEIRVWKRYVAADGYPRTTWQVYALMLVSIVGLKLSKWTEKYEHLLEGTCVVCNRKLTNPESIKTGIGPVCAGRSSGTSELDHAGCAHGQHDYRRDPEASQPGNDHYDCTKCGKAKSVFAG